MLEDRNIDKQYKYGQKDQKIEKHWKYKYGVYGQPLKKGILTIIGNIKIFSINCQ